MTEAELRESTPPKSTTLKELSTYIKSLVDQPQDYGTCVYAMSLSAVAAFNYVAGQLGVTGFQASCADLDILRRTRSINGPFMILKLEDALFPQYDLVKRLQDALSDNADWLRGEAKKKLAEPRGEYPPHPTVLAHWQKLAEDPAQ